jgi:hypothetical protein
MSSDKLHAEPSFGNGTCLQQRNRESKSSRIGVLSINRCFVNHHSHSQQSILTKAKNRLKQTLKNKPTLQPKEPFPN